MRYGHLTHWNDSLKPRSTVPESLWRHDPGDTRTVVDSLWSPCGTSAAAKIRGPLRVAGVELELTSCRAAPISPTAKANSDLIMTYEYLCRACGHQWEAQQSIKEDPLKDCPQCGQPEAKRQISRSPGFILKGGGWYSDLYSSPGGSSKSEGGGSSESPAGSATGTASSSSPSSSGSSPTGGGSAGTGSTSKD